MLLVLFQGTRHSLAVIDELGRGTSTFDGTAIALASVEYITDVLQVSLCVGRTGGAWVCQTFSFSRTANPSSGNVHFGTPTARKLLFSTDTYVGSLCSYASVSSLYQRSRGPRSLAVLALDN